jgi:general secretion pathway protein A
MYKSFFGLRENPFTVNPNPRYLFLTPQTQEALDELSYGIQTRRGLFLLTGEVGTGKTTMVNHLLNRLHQQRTPTAFVFNCHVETRHLLDFILADFGVPFDSRTDSNTLMRLNRWLMERHRANDNPVLIVDEAQGLSFEALEEIRLLQNLETPSEKLLQIVLVGQPELEEKLNRLELRQLRQRITVRCKTVPLSLEECHGYIQARLHIAGANGKPVFTLEAMNAVSLLSRGIPRVMNLLCDDSLMSAYVEDVRPVPARIVEEAACRFQLGVATSLISPAAYIDPAGAEQSPSHPAVVKASGPRPRTAELVLKEPFNAEFTHPISLGATDRTDWPSSAPISQAPLGERASTRMDDPQVISFPPAHPQSRSSTEPEREVAGRFPDSPGLTSETAFQLLATMVPGLPAIASAPLVSLLEAGRDDRITEASRLRSLPRSEKFSLRSVMSGSTAQSLRSYGRTWILFLREWQRRFTARWKVRFSSIVSSLRKVQITASLNRSSRKTRQRLMNSIQAVCHKRPEWWSGSTSMIVPMVLSRTLASASQWLRQPFDRPQPRSAYSRGGQVRAKFGLKKV